MPIGAEPAIGATIFGFAVSVGVIVRYKAFAAFAARQGRIQFEQDRPPLWLQIMAIGIALPVAIATGIERVRTAIG